MRVFGLKEVFIKDYFIYGLLFVGMWVYFGFISDYILFFQEKSSVFVLSSDFLIENLHQPGGAIIYLGKLLTAFYFYPVTGAAILSGVIVLIIIFISKIFFHLTGIKGKIPAFIAGAALFFLHTDYHFYIYNDAGLLIQLIVFYLVLRSDAGKGWVPVLVLPLICFSSGGFTWIYILLISLYYIFYEGRPGLAKAFTIWLLGFVILFLSKKYVYFQPVIDLVSFPLVRSGNISRSILFLILSSALSILPLIALLVPHLPAVLKSPDYHVKLAATFFLILVFASAGTLRFNKKTKQYFYVEKLFYQEKYDEITAYLLKNPTVNSLTLYLNNLALCEKNRLNDLLFHFRQDPDGNSLFLKWEMGEETLRRGGYFYYFTGMINEANRWAYENLVMTGYTPEGLKMLIKTELITGNYKVASKYIHILSRTLFYKNEARKFEKFLFNDAAVRADAELGEKVREMPKSDFFTITDNPLVNLDKVLSGDSLNRKAFEYKMAYLLLRKDSRGIAEKVHYYERSGLKKIPVHIAEAVVAYSELNRTSLRGQESILTERTTGDNFRLFMTTFRQYGSNLKSAEPALRKQFENTFWYYAFYR